MITNILSLNRKNINRYNKNNCINKKKRGVEGLLLLPFRQSINYSRKYLAEILGGNYKEGMIAQHWTGCGLLICSCKRST